MGNVIPSISARGGLLTGFVVRIKATNGGFPWAALIYQCE